MNQDKKSSANNSEVLKTADRIYHQWDEALAKNDVEKLLAFYHPDAIFESPLIPHLMGKDHGICKGLDEIRKFIELAFKRKPAKRKNYSNKYFTDGKILMWEYPRLSPDGEQMDFVEIMELKDGLIQYHRVYWGWYGFNVLIKDKYHR